MEFKQRLRTLWHQTTQAERTLWHALKNPNQNPILAEHHFSRHAVVGDFFIDFVCRELKLAIELDSGQTSKFEADQTTVLQYKGYLVVRLWQKDILNNLQGVLDYLAVVLIQRRLVLLQQYQKQR